MAKLERPAGEGHHEVRRRHRTEAPPRRRSRARPGGDLRRRKGQDRNQPQQAGQQPQGNRPLARTTPAPTSGRKPPTTSRTGSSASRAASAATPTSRLGSGPPRSATWSTSSATSAAWARPLKWDPVAERFTNCDEANKLLVAAKTARATNCRKSANWLLPNQNRSERREAPAPSTGGAFSAPRRPPAAGISLPCLIPADVLGGPDRPGANEQIHVGLIGAGGRPRDLATESPDDLKLVAVADCDRRQITSYLEAMRQSPHSIVAANCARYQDYRQMFAKEKLDGVFVATPTHARTLICIHAMQSGLDVYAEKPLTLTIEEGQYLIRAERKYERVLQVGTQQRSIPINNFGSDLVRNGALGAGENGALSQLPGARTAPRASPAGDARRNELGPVVQPDRAGAVQSHASSGTRPVGPLPRLRRRRTGLGRDRLGGPRLRPGAAGPGDRRHRPHGDLARRTGA